MAIITLGAIGTAGFRFDQFDSYDFFDYDNNTKPTSTGVKVYADSQNFTEVKGTGLSYLMDGAVVMGMTAGTVTSLKQVSSGVMLFNATGLKISAKSLSDTLNEGNSANGVALLLSGSDTIMGTNRSDVIYGGAGNDILIGGGGKDKLLGGSGTDTASYATAAKGVTANLASRFDNTNDAAGDSYSSIENLTGSAYADKLSGNQGTNSLHGGVGNDTLIGHAGGDKLTGGSGNDTLYGGLDADDLAGGSGADRFLFKTLSDSTVGAAGRDTIVDFSGSAGDLIDLSAIDADSGRSGNQAFTYLKNGHFTGEAGELRYVKQSTDTYIYGDVNGDGKADFAIHLDDAMTMSKGDFFL